MFQKLGIKGPKRLARWSPNISLLLQEKERIRTKEEFDKVQASVFDDYLKQSSEILNGGIFLEGATLEDFASVLHLRGAHVMAGGVLYSPSHYFGKNDPSRQEENTKLATPFLWYQSILEQTLKAEPILHCYGLHEWAMQYHPEGAPPPPSAKYQAHLQLRVPREVINETVERKGISCTHVDALRFFAPAAAPLNHHGSSLERMDQLYLEQPACVHAHMDLLKIAIKLRPFCDPMLLTRVLEIALKARTLDVAASPYDATMYGVGIVPIEKGKGRAQYKKHQTLLMESAALIRADLLSAYKIFLPMAFSKTCIQQGYEKPQPERLYVTRLFFFLLLLVSVSSLWSHLTFSFSLSLFF